MSIFLAILVVIILAGGILCTMWLSRMTVEWKRQRDLVFLQLLVPKKESKEDKEVESEQFSTGKDFREVLGVMDHLFEGLHGVYLSRIERFWHGQPFFSVEYAALAGEILLYVVCPRKLAPMIEKQITAFYPDTIIDEVEDYNIFTEESVVAVQPLLASKNFTSVFKTYQQLKSDPFNNITNAFSKLKTSEGAAVQIVLKPVKSGWQKKLQKEAAALINPKKKSGKWWNPVTWLSAAFGIITSGDDISDFKSDEQSTGERVSQMAEDYSKSVDEKAGQTGFQCVIRLVASADSQPRANSLIEEIVAAFGQFNSIRGNRFRRPRFVQTNRVIERFIRRSPRRTWRQACLSPKMLLGASELTGLFHLPNIKYNKVETIKWQNFKVAAAPKDLPKEGLLLGTNSYRGDKNKVFMKNEDRFRHLYIIGQTGTGKSSIMQIMARHDFHNGKGLCVVDPHGSLVEDLLPYIPRERADDVIYFNPADTERPMGLNLLEGKSPEERDLIALDAMNMMVKMFGNEIFGPRIQDYFRNGCLTLMEDEEEGGAITDLVKLFTDEEWQKYKVSKVQNPIVKSFWEKQMAQTGQREKQEMIPYFAAKFGQFYTNRLIRNIVGQTKSAFDISEVMNSGKILLVNLSKGLVGDINSQLLGMIFVNKIQVAAMRRQRQSKDERNDFFLYIDEFQNFVTDSIESILSEARKYRLGLILAHQYIDQLEKDDRLSGKTNLKGAIFGNVGTMMFYKIGPQDAEVCAKEMAPVFSEQDLVNMDAFKGSMKLCIDGKPSRPFSIEVPRPWLDTTYPKDPQAAEAFKQLSRLTYGRQKEFVDREILRRIG
ncbi:type IV secretion system DNA-binding domain-containing protein [Patescibacteria group bacterium]|nr:type IV secretion system DNA-binding domain-containing protein [Patescibacteria group bacterium]MBU1124350.1 type IV secretion system DNA-binding domain-containing protein [Patescibacteria group bacterium]MBU1911266.1 type IV secretion system DNA-binding domain-containing protein [Patescibacteria group bacterium]